MESVSGMTGAGPLFRDIMLLVAEGKYEEFKEPGHIIRKAICPLSGALPSSRCPSAMEEIFIEGTEPKTVCPLTHEKENARETLELRSPKLAKNRLWITFPRDGDIFKIDPVLRRDFQAVELKALISGSIEVRSVEWWINDRKIGDSGFPYACSWKLAPGTYSIKARAVFNAGVLESRPVRIIVLS
jgi:penicillin-binding protein 1C